MAKQNTVVILDQYEVADALADYIKKHYGEDVDVASKDTFVIGYSGARDTIDKIEIVVEEEDIEDQVDDDSPREAGYTVPRAGSTLTEDDLDFSLPSGNITPRAKP